MDMLGGVGVEDPHRRGVAIGGDQAMVQCERPDCRAHIAAIAAPVDAGFADGDLREAVIHVGLGPGRTAEDAGFGQRAQPAAHAIKLAAVGIGAAHRGKQDRILRRDVGRQVRFEDHQSLARAAAHEGGGNPALVHGGCCSGVRGSAPRGVWALN